MNWVEVIIKVSCGTLLQINKRYGNNALLRNVLKICGPIIKLPWQQDSQRVPVWMYGGISVRNSLWQILGTANATKAIVARAIKDVSMQRTFHCNEHPLALVDQGSIVYVLAINVTSLWDASE